MINPFKKRRLMEIGLEKELYCHEKATPLMEMAEQIIGAEPEEHQLFMTAYICNDLLMALENKKQRAMVLELMKIMASKKLQGDT